MASQSAPSSAAMDVAVAREEVIMSHVSKAMQWFILRRVASDTSFKEGYFFGAFSILPDTSFLLWS